MRKLLLILTLLISSVTFSQDTPAVRFEDTTALKRSLDDAQHFLDSMKHAEASREAAQGLQNLLRYQDEQNAKKKKQAFLYLGLGIFFLVVLIVGLRRRRKK
ncbi:MAG: hypothetical protein WDN26_17120 [Chitinophagaceae bacterium]